jgi:hypothetical protein
MKALLGQSWLTARGVTGGLLLAGSVLVMAGILMFTWRVFLHAPAGARPGYFQWERGLVFSGFLAVALGLAGLKNLLVQAGDPLWADIGLTAYALGAVLLTIGEVATLTAAGLPDGLVGGLIRVFVVLSFLGQAAFGAAILQTGLLPAWMGWTTVIWHLGWLALMLRAGDPYYPFMHMALPVLAGIWLLAKR